MLIKLNLNKNQYIVIIDLFDTYLEKSKSNSWKTISQHFALKQNKYNSSWKDWFFGNICNYLIFVNRVRRHSQ